MTTKEAIKALRLEGGLEISGNARRLAEFMQGLDVALTALRGPTREMVERMRGEWTDVYMSSLSSFVGTCSACHIANDIPHPIQAYFCPHCGAPMTDEAVDMMLRRWKEAAENA